VPEQTVDDPSSGFVIMLDTIAQTVALLRERFRAQCRAIHNVLNARDQRIVEVIDQRIVDERKYIKQTIDRTIKLELCPIADVMGDSLAERDARINKLITVIAEFRAEIRLACDDTQIEPHVADATLRKERLN
jgi:hypothetical protein